MGGGFKHARFQFQNGSINSPINSLDTPNNTCELPKFQFQNGSINRGTGERLARTGETFQFQNGSINSWIVNMSVFESSLFQFQNGSINSSAYTIRKIYDCVSIPKWFD